jgi:hypothetical protein
MILTLARAGGRHARRAAWLGALTTGGVILGCSNPPASTNTSGAEVISAAGSGKEGALVRYTCAVRQFSSWDVDHPQVLEIGARDAISSHPVSVGPYQILLSGYPTLETFITIRDGRIPEKEKGEVAQAMSMDGTPFELAVRLIDIDVDCRPVKA